MWKVCMECEGPSDSGVVLWWWRGVSLKHDWGIVGGRGVMEGVWV